MLKSLHISNIVLVEKASIEFEKGLHIFSGETGAGKTAILQALLLSLGQRADPSLIRKGCDIASVGAYFENINPIIYQKLNDLGVEIEDGEPLIIKREISTNQKNRQLINNQNVSLFGLKSITPYLIEVVTQHGSTDLLESNYQRAVLDQFAQNETLLKEVSQTFSKLKSAKLKLEQIEALKSQDLAQRQKDEEEYQEIEALNLESEDEDQKLFEEYQKLQSALELKNSSYEIYYQLIENDPAILFKLKEWHSSASKLSSCDVTYKNQLDDFLNQIEALQESAYQFLSYSENVEENPDRLQFIEERLSSIEEVKKKYGPTLKQVIEHFDHLGSKLEQFLDLPHQKEQLEKEIEILEKEFSQACLKLSKKRASSKKELEKRVEKLFQELNLKDALFEIELKDYVPNELGAEEVNFFFQANIGEKKVLLKDSASGGELARVLLCLKVILFEFDHSSTLIFDEIDAHVGGETALKLGQLLKKLSTKKQIISITHQPQVAAQADVHYLIEKKLKSNRTLSLIEKLDSKARQKEIERMLGGKSLSQKARDLAQDLIN